MRSVEKDLAALHDRLGPSPLAEVVTGIDHLHYTVAPGHGHPLVREYLDKTAYALTRHFLHTRTRTQYFLLELSADSPALVIEEETEPLAGPARLTAIAFRARDLDGVREFFQNEEVRFRETPAGPETVSLPGLEIAFRYVPAAGMPWSRSDVFAPGLDVEELRKFATTPGTAQAKIGVIDHIAFRLRLRELEAAAAMIMRLTPYRFTDCYTVGDENAETMVFRHGDRKPALVASYGWDEESVVWGYVAKYGPRVHHTAFYTGDLPAVFTEQRARGVAFTTPEIIGRPDRGILQIFTTPSPYHHEITEYIQRFGTFTGFFDPGNVGELMSSTRPYNE